jgi:hypothetical protein
MPATRSNAETIRPIVNEFEIETMAVFIKSGWSKTFWIVPTFVIIPIIGGIRIIARKMIIAEK